LHGCKKAASYQNLNKNWSKSVTGAFHPQEQEHGDDCQEGADGVGDDELEGIVVGDQQDVEHSRGRKVAGQQAAGVGQHCASLNHGQAEERNRPDSVENLKLEEINIIIYLTH